MSSSEPSKTSLRPPDRTQTFDACETPPTSIVNAFGKVEIVAGSRVRPETAFQAVLRQRLLAASVVLCVGFGLFLIRSFFYERPLQGWHTMVVFAEGVCVALLSSPRPFSLRQLRWFELVTFGLPVLFFVPYLHTFMLFEARRGSAVLTLAAFKSVALYWLVTMVFYGLLVPNDWRRAAKIVIPMTFVPPLVAVLTRPFHALAAQVVTFEQWSDVQLVLIIGAVCSIYGTHIMNSLRQEAIEARHFGQYRLVRRLGEGGMGQVFLAEHQLLKRPCAIKLIKAGPLCHPQALARFEREVRATAKLTHWNTIDIYDYGRTDDGTFYYVMEYLPGVNLDELIREAGPLPPARVVHVLRQLCQALREAHGQGLIHRDIKPSNVILCQRGGVDDVAKLLDFGLVKSTTEANTTQLTQEGTITGTPKYMSPEQCSGNGSVDARSDIYSLGAVAYALLSGRAPFERPTSLELIVAHLRDPVTPLGELQPTIPADLQEMVLRCLKKNPDERFPDVATLDQALAASPLAGAWTPQCARQWWQERETRLAEAAAAPAVDDGQMRLAPTRA